MTKLNSALWAIALMLVATSSGEAQQAGDNLPLIRLRIAQEEPTNGMERMETSVPGEAYFLAADDIIADRHIAQVLDVSRTDSGLTISLQLTEEGASRLRQMTSSQVGKRLGIVIGSRLRNAPVITRPLTLRNNRVLLGLPVSQIEAASIAAAVEARFRAVR